MRNRLPHFIPWSEYLQEKNKISKEQYEKEKKKNIRIQKIKRIIK